MEKEVKLGSRGKTQAQAEQDYPKQLGRALYYTISTVAHYARYKTCLFPQTPQWTYTRTSDCGEDQLVLGMWLLGAPPRAFSASTAAAMPSSLAAWPLWCPRKFWCLALEYLVFLQKGIGLLVFGRRKTPLEIFSFYLFRTQ